MLPRLYDALLADHASTHRQMALVAGPRQVGKTTTCRALAAPGSYLNWDDIDHRRIILAGPAAVAKHVGLDRLAPGRTTVVFDELHKYRRWKTFLKGFFDTHGERAFVIVTGSGRLDVYRRGGDSLMGRYFLYRMHPLSVAELLHPDVPSDVVRGPKPIADAAFEALWSHGGYPEPFLKRDRRFSSRWRRLRTELLVREDVREVAAIQDLSRLEALVAILDERSSTAVVYSNLAEDLQVSVDTVRRWIDVLARLGHGFLVRPWSRRIAKAIRKEPKWYSADWAGVADLGGRAETAIAGHLLKAVETWTDLGFGRFEVRYLRDKAGREVDFAVIRDGRPWMLVEATLSDMRLSSALEYFQRQTGAAHAFQAVWQADHVNADCFSRTKPTVVPARTLLSQLV
jgi:predicted AAA+ superfamily ATPase